MHYFILIKYSIVNRCYYNIFKKINNQYCILKVHAGTYRLMNPWWLTEADHVTPHPVHGFLCPRNVLTALPLPLCASSSTHHQGAPFSPASGPWHMLMLLSLPAHLNSLLSSEVSLDNSSLPLGLPQSPGLPHSTPWRLTFRGPGLKTLRIQGSIRGCL